MRKPTNSKRAERVRPFDPKLRPNEEPDFIESLRREHPDHTPAQSAQEAVEFRVHGLAARPAESLRLSGTAAKPFLLNSFFGRRGKAEPLRKAGGTAAGIPTDSPGRPNPL